MRILLCGASGMIGHKLWQVWRGLGLDVFGTVHGNREVLERYELPADRIEENFEAEEWDSVVRTLDKIAPDVVVNCIGITKRKTEASDPGRMLAVNSRFPHQLARWAASHGARVVQFSTDCVFDGSEGNYTERSVMTAPDLYGQTKYFGELGYPHCLTIRTSMIGREITGHTELLEWFLAQRGKRIKGFRRALYSGLTTPVMARILQRLISDFPLLNGICQIAGPIITKYDLLCQLRDAFQVDVEIVPDETFRCDRTLQSRKFKEATGMDVPSWPEMIAELSRDQELYDRVRSQN